MTVGTGFSQSDQYAFSRLDISDGLSNNQANCFFKDEKGFLWIGTMSGLNRYDGYRFRIFKHDLRDTSSLSDDFISRILEGPGQKLWIETRSGFNVFDPLKEKFSRDPSAALREAGVVGNTVTDIKKDRQGNFWFLMDRQVLYKYTTATKKSAIISKTENGAATISSFAFDRKGQCFIVYQGGDIRLIDPNSGKVGASYNGARVLFADEKTFYSLFIDNENELWIYATGGNPKGVLRFNTITGEYTLFGRDNAVFKLNTNLVVSVEQDNKGDIWICTDHGGVNVFNKASHRIQYILHNEDEAKSLSQNSITVSYKDNTGIIWLGTYKKGISYYHENIIKFPVYRHHASNANSLPFDDVNRFVEDRMGNLWIGTNGGGLIHFDRATKLYSRFLHQPGVTNTISNNVIVSLYIDHQQKLWIGTYFGGLDCYDLRTGHFTHYKHGDEDPGSLSDDRVWEIFEDSKNTLWVGTLSGGLNRFDRESNTFFHYRNQGNSSSYTLNSNYIAALFEDRDHNLWIGTDNGVDVLDNAGKRIAHYENYTSAANGLSNNNVISLLEDSRGLIWIGTRDGLNLFNKRQKNFKSFRTENGLPGNTILNILEDNNHHLWLSTNNGISKVRIQADDPATITISCINYDELDGLQGTEFNENAALKTSKGEIIFGGANGFNLFHPDNIKSGQSLPNLVLTDLQLFNKSVGIDEKIKGRVILPEAVANASSVTLKYNENILALEFAALNFSNPEKIKYAYKLEGFNKEWVYTDAKMRKAVYTNLDPGTYVFKLKATNEEGEWAGNELAFKIRITPPFWRTPLAFVLYVVVIAAALWFARKLTVERTRMRFEVEHQRKEAERAQALDEMKTKFFTNVSHELRTPLSLILSPLDKIVKKTPDSDQKKQLHLVQRNAKRLLNLVNQLLDFRKMEVQNFSVRLAKEDIVRFTNDITCSFSDISDNKNISLTFRSNVEKLETLFDKDKLEKILFNLLSNAFKFTNAGGKVDVEMNYKPTTNAASLPLTITVRDNGIGIPKEMHEKIFERYFQHDLPGNMHNYGTGIGLAITKEFVKLHNGTIHVESEQEKGTSFIVSLPVLQQQEIQEDPIVETAIPGKEPIQEIEEDNGKTNGKLNGKPGGKHYTILLVEDNEDFRFYLKDNLKRLYNVLEAHNGKEGWEKVRDIQPDLVVSDIMMPLMNGIELSRKIKHDPRTSHIPVLLLTAMTEVETQLEGFQAGISDYITKPFTFEILASRIRSLLSLREQLIRKFQKQVEIKPEEITITSVDQDFMKRALEVVEKNMDNPDFSVEDLSRELHMSRVALYKKLLSLTGKTPIEFIRLMRLKRAAQLIKQSQKTISEVAYEVGFNNPKIFTRYFKEEFNMTPSEFQSKP